MQAAVIHDVDAPPRYDAFPDPATEPGFVVARVEASAVHQIVRSIASGRFYAGVAEPPFVPGIDGVVRLPGGRRVYAAAIRPPYGFLADLVAVPDGGVEVPEGLDSATASALVNPALASWGPIQDLVEEGSTALVLGATGVSGSLAVEAAKLRGAGRVIAAGRDGAALERLRDLGADDVVLLDDAFPDRVREVGAGGIDVVLDFIWGQPAIDLMGALTGLGVPPWRPVHWVQIGSAAGEAPAFPAALLRTRGLHLVGNGIGSGDPARRPGQVAEVFAEAAAGRLTIDFEERPLAEVESTWSNPARLVYLP